MEKLSTGVLIASSIIALTIGISDLFFNLESISYVKKTPQISLILLGTLGIALGVERAVNFEELKKELLEIKKSISSTTTSQFVQGREESYSLVSKIILDSKSKVDVLGMFSLSETEDEFNEQKSLYLNALIKAMKSNVNIDCRIVFGIASPQLSQQQIISLKRRRNLFRESGLLNRVRFHQIILTAGLNIMIIDNQHLAIGFPTLSLVTSLRSTIKLSGNTELVDSMSKWYEDFAWSKSTPINLP